jgi:septal ring factor EnvC (AmiA/AmiB activator)
VARSVGAIAFSIQRCTRSNESIPVPQDIQDEITKDKEKHKVLVTNSQHLEHRIKSAAKQIRDEEKDLETRKKEHGMLKDKEDKMVRGTAFLTHHDVDERLL